MTAIHLPSNFASQSNLRPTRIVVLHAVALDRRIVTLLEADLYPQRAAVRVEGLIAGRHYHLLGASHRFCRTDADGVAMIDVVLKGPTSLVIAPVV